MCLAVPGQVRAIDGDLAVVDFWGEEKAVRLDVVDEPVAAGDWVLCHAGFAVQRVPAARAEDALRLYAAVLAAEDREEDG
jgi:hydrogenase expression/formation protein HypC